MYFLVAGLFFRSIVQQWLAELHAKRGCDVFDRARAARLLAPFAGATGD